MYKKPQIINIENRFIPIILTKTTTKYTEMIGVQGIIQIKQNNNDPTSLRSIINTAKEDIIDVYNQMTKTAVMDRTRQDYVKQCINLIEQFSDQIGVKPKKVRQTPMLLDKFGLTYHDKSITLNAYLQYMNDDIIENTIYHELCHVYTIEHYGTMEHDEHFYEQLYKKYPEELNNAILKS